jgi:exodeoxyribonuclease VII small subunit
MKAIQYEDAIRQLEDIVNKLENNELDIDEMPAELKKAQQLLRLCRDRLTKTDEEIRKIQEGSEGKSE